MNGILEGSRALLLEMVVLHVVNIPDLAHDILDNDNSHRGLSLWEISLPLYASWSRVQNEGPFVWFPNKLIFYNNQKL